MQSLTSFNVAVLALLASGAAFAHAADVPTPITPVPAPASLRVATVQVRVVPDHPDWTYHVGERASFRVVVTADQEPLTNVRVRYEVGPEMMPPTTTKDEVAVPAGGLVIDGGTLNEPGFIRCIVTADVSARTYRGLATAGFDPEKIVAWQTEPQDFDAFWNAGKAELAKVPMDARLTLLPDACTAKVNVYHVSFCTATGPENPGPAKPARIYGILCEPKTPGKYPAVLKVPGAHVRPYFGDKDLAARGVITLEIGIEGIPVNLPQELYDALDAGALNSYWLSNLDDRETYYYHRVFLGCIRANDFLVSREMWDEKNLVVMGASQGGQLAIATAALDPRVTGLSATHPAFCDVAAELHGRAGGFPHPFHPDVSGAPSKHATPAKIATAAYYDTVNFARRLRVPGHYLWGYNDEVCPPSSTFAAYNVITAPKELNLLLEVGHAYPPEQWEATNAWIVKFLRLK